MRQACLRLSQGPCRCKVCLNGSLRRPGLGCLVTGLSLLRRRTPHTKKVWGFWGFWGDGALSLWFLGGSGRPGPQAPGLLHAASVPLWRPRPDFGRRGGALGPRAWRHVPCQTQCAVEGAWARAFRALRVFRRLVVRAISSGGLKGCRQVQKAHTAQHSHSARTALRVTRYKINLEGLVALCKRRGFVFPSGEARRRQRNPEISLGRGFLSDLRGIQRLLRLRPTGCRAEEQLEEALVAQETLA